MWFPPSLAHPAPSLLRSRNHAGNPRLYALPFPSLHFNASPITPIIRMPLCFVNHFHSKGFMLFTSQFPNQTLAHSHHHRQNRRPRKQYYEKSQPGWVGFWFSFGIFIIFLPLHIHSHNLPSAPVRLAFCPCRGKLQLIEPLKIMGQLMGQGIED